MVLDGEGWEAGGAGGAGRAVRVGDADTAAGAGAAAVSEPGASTAGWCRRMTTTLAGGVVVASGTAAAAALMGTRAGSGVAGAVAMAEAMSAVPVPATPARKARVAAAG